MKTDKDGFIVAENAENILKKCEKASCLLIGCGLGHTAQTEKLVAELIENAEIPIVLDADGINSLCPECRCTVEEEKYSYPYPSPCGACKALWHDGGRGHVGQTWVCI